MISIVFTVCTNFTYDPNEFAILMDVMMNEDSLYHNMVSAKNPEPICVPVPYVPAGVDMCIKLFNIFTPGRNLHMCMDLQARVAKAPIIVSFSIKTFCGKITKYKTFFLGPAF